MIFMSYTKHRKKKRNDRARRARYSSLWQSGTGANRKRPVSHATRTNELADFIPLHPKLEGTVSVQDARIVDCEELLARTHNQGPDSSYKEHAVRWVLRGSPAERPSANTMKIKRQKSKLLRNFDLGRSERHFDRTGRSNRGD